jgi:hypothetical protein
MGGPRPAEELVTEPRRSRAEDAREVAWRLLVGTGAGAIVGLVIGGIGGRLVMLVLRLTSDPGVLGLETDDGFEIGRFTTSTLFLLTVTAGLGGALGAAYASVRSVLPHRGRAALSGVSLALYGGADLLKPRSFDFTALGPKALIVVSFVLLPFVFGLVMAPVVERLLEVEPWSSRRLTAVLVLGSLPLVPVSPLGAAAFGVALFVRRKPEVGQMLTVIGRVAVPAVLVVAAVKSGVELWRDAGEML